MTSSTARGEVYLLWEIGQPVGPNPPPVKIADEGT